MMEPPQKLAELMTSFNGNAPSVSGATSPGAGPQDVHDIEAPLQASRSRPRVYPYFRYLPYAAEEEEERQHNLNEIIKHLYVAIEAGDFAPGAVHWTRELRSWLSLKFDPTREQRVKLVKLYYDLSLAPGIDFGTAERFASMLLVLAKRKHYLRPVTELILDWRPLFRELKLIVIPSESSAGSGIHGKRNFRTLLKICNVAQLYVDPKEMPAMMAALLPFYNTSFVEGAFVVSGLFNLLFPTSAPPSDEPELRPQRYLPTFFHLWSLVNRSKVCDTAYVDLFSRLARDLLHAEHIGFSEYGIFTKEQSAQIFTAILRLMEIPVGQATSAYSTTVDASVGLGIILERDAKKHPVSHHIARWIVMSLSPACLDKPDSILSHLEGLIQAVETFFHPSNSGSWTRLLAQLAFYLADFFVMRWNREASGEMEVPPARRLNGEIKRRFVLCLRDVIFMGIYAKSGTAMNSSLSTLQSLAFLEPDLIFPGALQRIYPSMQGLVEVHRTTSSLRALQILAKTMVGTKGFRCHVTTMLGLALPGIDANDLDKTLYTLSYLQSVCYNIPFHDLTKGSEVHGSMLAVDWVTAEAERMERDGVNVELDYARALSDTDEELILRSSTAGLADFLTSFLGRAFTLLENLPDPARIRSGSPEENVVNTLPATFTPLLASLSPELYDLALNKIADFVANNVIHQARDAMAFICNSLCKTNPTKALKRLIPILLASIRTEIEENAAGSTRNTGSDILPRDRGLVWSVSMLSMCVVHVGDAVLPYRKELFEIAIYMQKRCQGIPTVHISNYIHHLLLNLTGIYTVDFSIFEPDVLAQGLGPRDWGRTVEPDKLTIKWHTPSAEEIDFALDLFKSQSESAMQSLTSLLDGSSPIKSDGTGKAWSDELSRNLVLLKLLLAGVAVLFDPKPNPAESDTESTNTTGEVEMVDADEVGEPSDDLEALLSISDDAEARPTFQYPTGYALKEGDAAYEELHAIRVRVGKLLHDVHQFLNAKNEDDVSCFTSLYTAYRSWFIDVGIEKSAHVLDRVTRLFVADVQPYKVSGLRKEYPRSILLRRANVYHLQRLRHNAAPRSATALDKLLLLDLAESSISPYTQVRRNAQSALDSAARSVLGARSLLLPSFLKAFEEGVKEIDEGRIKGAMHVLLFGALTKTMGRDWRYTPATIKTYLAACAVDNPAIQKLCTTGTQYVMDWSRSMDQMAILNREVIRALEPEADFMSAQIKQKRATATKKREAIEQRKAALSDELVLLTKESHWIIATRTAAIAVTLGFRFNTLASDGLVSLILSGSIDNHPTLRGLYAGALVTLFSLIGSRTVYGHKYENELLDKQNVLGKLDVPTRRNDPKWTTEHLASFARAETEYYVDQEHPGWLVWNDTMPGYRSNIQETEDYDDEENRVIDIIGKALNRSWFATYFKFLLQEPRDTSSDRFRTSSAMMLGYAFDLMHNGRIAATFEEVQEEVVAIFGDGVDRHQHRAASEIMAGMLGAIHDKKIEIQARVWDFCMPIIYKIFSDGLTPENSSYWTSFQHLQFQSKDPRRSWPLLEWLAKFRLDMASNAAFKESSKISLLRQCITDSGWHFQLEKPILADFLQHLDHPYKGVREAMGHTLAAIFRTRYHESYKSIEALMQHQRDASSVGTRSYQPTEEFRVNMHEIFERLERWRLERTPGQQTPSSYTSGSKTVLIWLESTLSSYECTQLFEFFPTTFIPQLLHMMDVKEDQELQGLAYHVFRHIPNIPHAIGDDAPLIDSLIHIGKTSPLWHQRLRVLINIQVLYFRRLFLIARDQQARLFTCVADMLNDAQLEVRMGAANTISGMIRCSPVGLRATFVDRLSKQFTAMLVDNPLPKKPRNTTAVAVATAAATTAAVALSAPVSRTGTPTTEHTKLVLTRHAAVLGLGALVQAFPYASSPPSWVPGVLTTLANKANNDPGMVGKSVKSILADYKKIRQDTWHMDLKVFTPEQIEDLEGVLWKSYFA